MWGALAYCGIWHHTNQATCLPTQHVGVKAGSETQDHPRLQREFRTIVGATRRVCRCTRVFSTLQRPREEDQEFEASLGYVMSSFRNQYKTEHATIKN
ncbi:hypothetical protein I79_005104 [Cricetulus griseus]|uniref:Uncharacterized protein n=1 Tax=Cricetulus griseus TaxID=10029 RepID=G3H4A4_CRIGR|nr:hypothetical protein I79_005104 [Cricetulus griseus]